MDAPTLNKPANRLLYLDIARALAIFLVCLNHAVNRGYSNYHKIGRASCRERVCRMV